MGELVRAQGVLGMLQLIMGEKAVLTFQKEVVLFCYGKYFRPCSACQKYDSISTFTVVFLTVILFLFGLVFGNHKYYCIFYKNTTEFFYYSIFFL